MHWQAFAGANGNIDFGSIAEPANVVDKNIVQATITPTGPPQYRPATGFTTPTTHGEPPAQFFILSRLH